MKHRLFSLFLLSLWVIAPTNTLLAEDLPSLYLKVSKAENNVEKLEAFDQLIEYFLIANRDSAMFYATKGEKEFESQNYPKGVGTMLLHQASVLMDEGMLDKMRVALDKAQKNFQQISDQQGLAKAESFIGVADGKSGNYTDAVKHFLNALKICQSIGYNRGIVSNYLRLGTVNDLVGNIDEALAYYQEGLAIAHKFKLVDEVYILNNIASLYGRQEKLDVAEEYLNKALNLSDTTKDVRSRLSVLSNLGTLNVARNNPKKAVEYINEGIEMASRSGYSEEIVRFLLVKAEALTLQNPKDAEPVYFQALDKSKEFGLRRLQSDILASLSDHYALQGDFKKAYQYLQWKQDLKDSIVSIEKAKEIANLQSVQELNEAEAKMDQLNLTAMKNTQNRNIIIAIALALGFGLLLSVYYIVTIRKLNHALAHREEELQNSNAVKDKMFSIIGHDLKGATGNILALIGLYRDDQISDVERNYILDSLEESATTSNETLDLLLNWGKMQIKGISIHKSSFDTDKVIQDTFRFLKLTASQKQITLLNKVEENTIISADADQFRFVIRNLLSNAIKFSRNNSKIELVSAIGKNHFIQFSIKDEGIGIEPERLPHIFEPFHKSTPGTAAEVGNSIGLMLCKEFVQRNGGEIWAESKKGVGTTVHFTMPMV
ncbi:MAG: tetratricopeptide repeat-containing sensor histidine kinase [Bacteroidetes bacterium]|nr:tetratricopeptide repeat-containing sensor histidine kinase [Bacteroidota bacterium]MBS1740355.1 tetratricopeptide repeat-containing sensor histidine kinase [Bacteroidota bacterium]